MPTKKQPSKTAASAKTKVALRDVSYVSKDMVLQTGWLTDEIYQALKKAVFDSQKKKSGTQYPSLIVLQVAIIEEYILLHEGDGKKRDKDYFHRYYLPRHELRKALAVPNYLLERMREICKRDNINGSDFLYNAFLYWYLKED